jgi:hypothetical protein
MKKTSTRDLRFSIPLNAKELRLVAKAAKIVGDRPAPYARDVLKRMSRQVLQRAGVRVNLDMDDFAGDATGSPEQAEDEV